MSDYKEGHCDYCDLQTFDCLLRGLKVYERAIEFAEIRGYSSTKLIARKKELAKVVEQGFLLRLGAYCVCGRYTPTVE